MRFDTPRPCRTWVGNGPLWRASPFTNPLVRHAGVGRDSNKNPTQPGLIALPELEAAQSEAAAVAQRLFVLAERIGVADARPPKPYGAPAIQRTLQLTNDLRIASAARSLLFDSFAAELGR